MHSKHHCTSSASGGDFGLYSGLKLPFFFSVVFSTTTPRFSFEMVFSASRGGGMNDFFFGVSPNWYSLSWSFKRSINCLPAGGLCLWDDPVSDWFDRTSLSLSSFLSGVTWSSFALSCSLCLSSLSFLSFLSSSSLSSSLLSSVLLSFCSHWPILSAHPVQPSVLSGTCFSHFVHIFSIAVKCFLSLLVSLITLAVMILYLVNGPVGPFAVTFSIWLVPVNHFILNLQWVWSFTVNGSDVSSRVASLFTHSVPLNSQYSQKLFDLSGSITISTLLVSLP